MLAILAIALAFLGALAYCESPNSRGFIIALTCMSTALAILFSIT